MKMIDVKKLETKKLHEQLAEAREKVVNFRFGVKTKKVKNVREARHLRKDIARILFEIKNRQKGTSAQVIEDTKK